MLASFVFTAIVFAAVPVAGPAVPAPAASPPPPAVCNAAPLTNQIYDPPEVTSVNGVLAVTLYLRGDSNPLNHQGLCWWHEIVGAHSIGQEWIPPTLHLRQGEQLRLTLVNTLTRPPQGDDPRLDINASQTDEMQPGAMGRGEDYTLMCGQPQTSPTPTPDPVTGRVYGYHRSPWNETNMHFHGLNVSPLQPSDDVVNVMLCPLKRASETPKRYTYVLNIPLNEPPGSYWYHPHAHGESDNQVLSQLTGAIIIDPVVPGLPQMLPNRLIIVRDVGEAGEDGADTTRARRIRAQSPSMSAIRASYTRGISIMNFGQPPFRFGTPQACPPPSAFSPSTHSSAKELRINTVPVPALRDERKTLPQTTMTLGATEYWRFVNTSADTLLDIETLVNGKLTPLLVASRDGVPLVIDNNGAPTWQPVPMTHVFLSPASRLEFYLRATTPGTIVLRTRNIHDGCLGDLTYERNLLSVSVKPAKRAPAVVAVPRSVAPVRMRFAGLARAVPRHHRYFVFTEYNREDEPLPDFYITELSNPAAVEHPFASFGPPDVVVKSGTVEDWTILNYTQEIHEFHIHQIHFLVLQGQGIEYGEHQMLDTVNVPYGEFAGKGSTFVPGAVTLRMDFRDPNIIGEFVYHCHILAHEDGGMMARIRVVP